MKVDTPVGTPVGDDAVFRTEVEEITKPDGTKVRITRKTKTFKTFRRVNKAAADRARRWEKFGKCAGAAGLEPGISGIGEPVYLVLGEDARIAKELEEKLKDDQRAMADMYRQIVSEADSDDPRAGVWRPSFRSRAQAEGGASPVPAAGKYIPAHMRRRGMGGEMPEEEVTKLRVTNLSEDTTEDDLRGMFAPYGYLEKIYLVRDRETGISRGFAFVEYMSRPDAAAAMAALDGKGWDNLILGVGWAKPRPPPGSAPVPAPKPKRPKRTGGGRRVKIRFRRR